MQIFSVCCSEQLIFNHQLVYIRGVLAAIDPDCLSLVRGQAVRDGCHGCRDLLGRVELSLRRTNPLAGKVSLPDGRIGQKSGCRNTTTRNGFGQPQLIDRTTKVIGQPFAPHPESLPRFEQRGTAGRIRRIERHHQQISRNFQRRADLLAQRTHKYVKSGARAGRIGKFNIFARFHEVDRTRSHFILVRVTADLRGTVAHLVERDFVRVCGGLDKRRKKALDHGRHDLGLGVPPHLQQRLDDLRQIRHAAVLFRALGVHDMQHIG